MREIRNLKQNDIFKHKGKTYRFDKLKPEMSDVYLIQENYSDCKVKLNNTIKVEVVGMESNARMVMVKK